MGLCLPCLGNGPRDPPHVEDRRLKLAEAAERRQRESSSRGILNLHSVEEKKKRKEKMEKQLPSGGPSQGGLRWTVS
ncbi:small VCP/p97-interacting protein [Phascolarctos cinereus]|uniref:Small VCP/p97-interacting protein n=1 Tax=Phascolarctos cinereus TaxID=38626 RepID=A0A6P5LHJ8_PHACI|nr:small VCP/p97-interacting protein [Phascolarctos cinereus]